MCSRTSHLSQQPFLFGIWTLALKFHPHSAHAKVNDISCLTSQYQVDGVSQKMSFHYWFWRASVFNLCGWTTTFVQVQCRNFNVESILPSSFTLTVTTGLLHVLLANSGIVTFITHYLDFFSWRLFTDCTMASTSSWNGICFNFVPTTRSKSRIICERGELP